MRLTTLKPRVAVLDTRRTQPAPKVASSFYLTPEWRAARELSIALHNWMCAKCSRSGCRLFVDHKVELQDGGAPYEQGNLEPLCGACHSIKTAKARAQRHKQVSAASDAVFPGWLHPTRADLTIVFGPPASGKTTYVERNAKPGDVILDLDLIASELSGAPIYQSGDHWVPRALAERNRRLQALAHGQTAWFVVTGAGDERHFWLGALRPARSVVIDTSEDECVRRVQADTRRPPRTKERQIAAIHAWWRAERG